MTEDELDAIERDFRGISEQREEFCTMCGQGWELWKVEERTYSKGTYNLHVHVAPWDYEEYGSEEYEFWPDPRPEVRKLLDEVRRLKRELGKDGV